MLKDLTGTKVTIFGIHYAPETSGNAPYTTSMAEALSAAGASVRVITGVPHYPQWKVLDPRYKKGSRWREHPNGVLVDRVRHFVPAKPNLLGRAGLEATFFVQCLRAAFNDRSDILIAVTPTLSGLLAALLCRRSRPVGALIQDLTGASAVESGTSGGMVAGLISSVEYWLLKRTDRVGIITPRFGSVLTANGIDPKTLVDLPNFTHITPVDATPAQARSRLGWKQMFSVVHTGNMGMKQGLETVVKAAALAEQSGIPLQFVLVGDGNQRSALEKLGAGCANLSFVDPLAAADYPYALAAADALLVSERRGVKEMSLPSKLTSYAVAGRPIIAVVDHDGITSRFLGEHSAARMTERASATDLLDVATEIGANPTLSHGLAAQAGKLHERLYSSAAAHRRYCDFATQLMADRAERRGRIGYRPRDKAPVNAGANGSA